MSKRFIGDLNREELKRVFENNEKLRSDIVEDMLDTEMYYIGEQLRYFNHSLSDWSIGVYNRNYMNISDSVKFIEGIFKMESSIPAFIDDDKPLLEDSKRLHDKYLNTNVYDDEFEEIEVKIDEIAKALADRLLQRFNEILEGCYNEEWQLDYFIDFYVDSRLDSDCYIEGDDYILKQDTVKHFN